MSCNSVLAPQSRGIVQAEVLVKVRESSCTNCKYLLTTYMHVCSETICDQVVDLFIHRYMLQHKAMSGSLKRDSRQFTCTAHKYLSMLILYHRVDTRILSADQLNSEGWPEWRT